MSQNLIVKFLKSRNNAWTTQEEFRENISLSSVGNLPAMAAILEDRLVKNGNNKMHKEFRFKEKVYDEIKEGLF